MRFFLVLLIFVLAGMIGFSSLAVGVAAENDNPGYVVFWFVIAIWNGFNLGGLIYLLKEW